MTDSLTQDCTQWVGCFRKLKLEKQPIFNTTKGRKRPQYPLPWGEKSRHLAQTPSGPSIRPLCSEPLEFLGQGASSFPLYQIGGGEPHWFHSCVLKCLQSNTAQSKGFCAGSRVALRVSRGSGRNQCKADSS